MKTIYEILFYGFATVWLFHFIANIKTRSKASILNAWKAMFYMNIMITLMEMEG